MDDHTGADLEFHEATAHLYESALLPVFGIYNEFAVKPTLDRFAGAAPGGRALDIGCGTGAVTVQLAARGFDVVGLDHSAAMLAVAEDKVSTLELGDRVELLVGDIRQLPFESASFDVVTCQGVLHHLTDVGVVVREIARVLKPGGLYYGSEPCEGSNMGLRAWSALRSLAGRARRNRPQPADSPTDTEFEDEHEEGPIDAHALGRIFSASGFDPNLEYWAFLEGSHRLPTRVQAALVRALSRPWKGRSGNLVVVTAARR